MKEYLLAIDQGTTSSRAIIFDRQAKNYSQHQIDLTQFYPHEGWVEHDPEEIWQNTLECCKQALHKKNLSANDVLAVGITNQRETTIIWDKTTGKPIYPAIVWQDRRTREICDQLATPAFNRMLQEKTGLLLDPYFSATKISWLLNTIPGARVKAENGNLLFGTVDTFLLWRLTKGKIHATDATNASRTLLFNIQNQEWDLELLSAFNIPLSLLPTVLDNCSNFGVVDTEWLSGSIPILSLIGDQQAATVGQGCFLPGQVKSTYGTGCFMMLNTGEEFVQSKHKLLSTVLYRINNKAIYGLEGSIFCAGASIKWLRDKLKIIQSAHDTEYLAQQVSDTGGVYFIPAFTGLGAPYWNPNARGAIVGLTRNSGVEHIVRAALEAVGYQSRDLLEAMIKDSQIPINELAVDGGMMKNQWLIQFLSDILNLNLYLPHCIETTALGTALLAGLQAGMFQSLENISHLLQDRKQYSCTMDQDSRDRLYANWKKAITQCNEISF